MRNKFQFRIAWAYNNDNKRTWYKFDLLSASLRFQFCLLNYTCNQHAGYLPAVMPRGDQFA